MNCRQQNAFLLASKCNIEAIFLIQILWGYMCLFLDLRTLGQTLEIQFTSTHVNRTCSFHKRPDLNKIYWQNALKSRLVELNECMPIFCMSEATSLSMDLRHN